MNDIILDCLHYTVCKIMFLFLLQHPKFSESQHLSHYKIAKRPRIQNEGQRKDPPTKRHFGSDHWGDKSRDR